MAATISKHELTVSEAMDECGCDRKTLYSYRRKGIGPRWVTRGGRIFYPFADFQHWLDHGEQR